MADPELISVRVTVGQTLLSVPCRRRDNIQTFKKQVVIEYNNNVQLSIRGMVTEDSFKLFTAGKVMRDFDLLASYDLNSETNIQVVHNKLGSPSTSQVLSPTPTPTLNSFIVCPGHCHALATVVQMCSTCGKDTIIFEEDIEGKNPLQLQNIKITCYGCDMNGAKRHLKVCFKCTVRTCGKESPLSAFTSTCISTGKPTQSKFQLCCGFTENKPVITFPCGCSICVGKCWSSYCIYYWSKADLWSGNATEYGISCIHHPNKTITEKPVFKLVNFYEIYSEQANSVSSAKSAVPGTNCPHCRNPFRVPADYKANVIACPSCQAELPFCMKCKDFDCGCYNH